MKVLIWNNFKLQERRGGPPTYLFNLKQSVKKSENQEIRFLDLYGPEDNKPGEKIPILKRIRKKLARYILNGRVNGKTRLRIFLKTFNNINPSFPQLDYNSYDFIHFHSSYDYYQYRKIRARYKGKTVLTLHCPKPPHLEMIEDVFRLDAGDINEADLERLKYFDDFAIKDADYLLFPCANATEPYLGHWSGFPDLIKGKKIIYVPTGIPQAMFTKPKEQLRNELGIPADAIVFCYLGRHNTVKGYDLLKDAAEIILSHYPKVYFLIAGAESPIKGLQHEHWIEMGWTSDPHSITNAADCFVLPNRETYFDLVLLEALSVNQKCILSYTGGNKYFEQFNHPDIFYFKEVTSSGLAEAMMNFIEKKAYNNPSSTAELFKMHFTNDIFMKNYLEALHKI